MTPFPSSNYEPLSSFVSASPHKPTTTSRNGWAVWPPITGYLSSQMLEYYSHVRSSSLATMVTGNRLRLFGG